MKKYINKRTTVNWKPAIYSALDFHKWEAKMETRRLLSGKPDLKIEPGKKQTG